MMKNGGMREDRSRAVLSSAASRRMRGTAKGRRQAYSARIQEKWMKGLISSAANRAPVREARTQPRLYEACRRDMHGER